MRCSTDKNDSGYHNYLTLGNIKVFLDDVEINYVMTFDTSEGYLLKAVEPIQADESGLIFTEELYGTITFEKV